ncbi:hypothetical protein ACFE04_030328 [Oxalis oulophora]
MDNKYYAQEFFLVIYLLNIEFLDEKEHSQEFKQPEAAVKANVDEKKGGENAGIAFEYTVKSSGEVNMEAPIEPDDVIRAGGFGARDDISSFLPVASDSTDFEAMIRDARGYEEPQEEKGRPGLGWSAATETN